MSGIGYKGVLGAAKQAAYLTAVDATDRVPFLSENLKVNPQFVNHEFIHGKASIPQQQNVFNPASGPVEVVVPYTTLDTGKFISASLLIAAALGTTAWDAANSVNQITPKDDLDVLLTVPVYKGVTGVVWEAIGAMVNSMTLTMSPSEALKASFEFIIGQLKTTSTGNTQAELEALPNDAISLATFNQLTFRIGDHADALSSSDELGISALEISINNNLSSEEQSTPDNSSGHSDAKLQIQPVRNGFREVTVTIEIHRYESDAIEVWKEANTALQADVEITDGTNYIKIFLPHLKIQDNEPPISGSGAIKQSVTFKALAYIDTSDLTFADASTDDGEIWIETKDDRTASILA